MTPEALAALHARCFTVPRPFTAPEFKSLLAVPTCFLCAVPQGFALGRAIAGEAELLTIAVDPDVQGQGIGATLVQMFLTEAKAKGAATAFLEVDARNARAIRLYSRAGFTSQGRRKDYYRHPDGPSDALVMRREIG